jgi:hypothetical protein
MLPIRYEVFGVMSRGMKRGDAKPAFSGSDLPQQESLFKGAGSFRLWDSATIKDSGLRNNPISELKRIHILSERKHSYGIRTYSPD